LDLSANDFTGSVSVPSSIGYLQNLRDFVFAFNQFPVSFPTEIGLLANLETMILAGNYVPIPSSLQMLVNLSRLRIGLAVLTGSMLEGIAQFGRLESLMLTDCHLTGTIPTEIARLNWLSELSLGSNKLSGPIPTEIGRLRLTVLDLSYNQLNGTIPSEPASLRDIDSELPIKLEGNDLVGSVPPALCRTMQEIHIPVSVDCDKVDCADCGCECPDVY
jgi:Leucine rich repeat